MYVRCPCDKCKGKLVESQILQKHCRAGLKNQTASKQIEWTCIASNAEPIADLSSCRHDMPPVLDVTDPSTTLHLPTQQEVLNPGVNTSTDIDIFPSHAPDYVHPGPILQGFKPNESPFINELPELPHYREGEDLLDLYKDPVENLGHKDDISTYTGPFHSEPNEDECYRLSTRPNYSHGTCSGPGT